MHHQADPCDHPTNTSSSRPRPAASGQRRVAEAERRTEALQPPVAAARAVRAMASFIASYGAKIESMGHHPDKVVINTLTSLATDAMAAPTPEANPVAIAGVVESKLLRSKASCKLTVMYLMDSIVYNCGGVYRDIFARNLVQLFPVVHGEAPPEHKIRLRRLLAAWSQRKPAHPYNIVVVLRHFFKSARVSTVH